MSMGNTQTFFKPIVTKDFFVTTAYYVYKKKGEK